MNGAWMISAKGKDASQPEKPPDNPIPLPRPENEPPRHGRIPEEPIAPKPDPTRPARQSPNHRRRLHGDSMFRGFAA
jgi:hypothetical protein